MKQIFQVIYSILKGMINFLLMLFQVMQVLKLYINTENFKVKLIFTIVYCFKKKKNILLQVIYHILCIVNILVIICLFKIYLKIQNIVI